MKTPRFRLLLPLLLALTGAAPEAKEISFDFRAMCPFDAGLCGQYDKLSADLDAEKDPTLGTTKLWLYNERLVRLVRGADEVVYREAGKWKLDQKQEIEGSIYGGIYMLRQKVDELSLRSAPEEIARLSKELLEEERRADMLIAELNGAETSEAAQASAAGRLEALDKDATGTWRDIKDLSLNVDRLGTPIESKPDGRLAPSGALVSGFINPLQERVAGLRDRLVAIKSATRNAPAGRTAASQAAAHEAAKGVGARLAAKGLDRDVFDHKAAVDAPGSGVAARPPPLNPGADLEPGSITLSVSPKRLLDNRPPPEIAKPTTPLPPRTFWQSLTGASPLYGGATFTEKEKDGKTVEIVEDAFPAETKRIAALRDEGKTSTVGDPGGRARFVFRQTGGTCALASQAQMYAEAHGVKPTRANMRKIEGEFFAKASVSNQFNGNSADPKQRWDGGGTPDEALGNMLDTPVKKHYLAKDEELFTAVSRGKMVMIAANTGLLWNDKRHLSGGHAVVVTGAEVDASGALLGYYINDTGTDEAARFVSARQFLPAWRDRGSIFIEPL